MKDIFATIGVACTLAVIIYFLFVLILLIKEQITKWRLTTEKQINILYRMAKAEPDARVRLGIIMAVKVLKTGEQKNDKSRNI